MKLYNETKTSKLCLDQEFFLCKRISRHFITVITTEIFHFIAKFHVRITKFWKVNGYNITPSLFRISLIQMVWNDPKSLPINAKVCYFSQQYEPYQKIPNPKIPTLDEKQVSQIQSFISLLKVGKFRKHFMVRGHTLIMLNSM